MKAPVRILLIVDSPHDAVLIEGELAAAKLGFKMKQIHTERELRNELEFRPPDLVLSDHGLPSFTGFAALEIVREQYPQLPFIFVSGSNDQAMIVEMYDRGATDYVFKGDIHDLDEAVNRALELKPEETFTQPAPDPQPPVVSQTKASPSLAPGHLLFCPNCRKTWDEKGVPIPLNKYLGSHAESIVVSHLCEECAGRASG